MSNCDRVYKYLDVTTAHLSPDERDGDRIVASFKALDHGFGWWVWVPHAEEDTAEVAEEFPCMIAVLAAARALGCLWINFDTDAEALDDLPTFEDEKCDVEDCLRYPHTGEKFCPEHLPSVPVDDPRRAKKCVKCGQPIPEPMLDGFESERCAKCGDQE